MGVSAAGYLAGKATRKAGPVLEYVGVKKPAGDITWWTLIAQGQNLASDARLFIDEKELGMATDAQKANHPKLSKEQQLVSATPQMGASDTSFSTELDIIILDPSIDLTKGDHTFRIVNRDGQFADISFAVDQPTITAVYESGNPPDKSNPKVLRATDKSLSVTIEGTGLVTGSTVSWRAPGSSPPSTS